MCRGSRERPLGLDISPPLRPHSEQAGGQASLGPAHHLAREKDQEREKGAAVWPL